MKPSGEHRGGRKMHKGVKASGTEAAKWFSSSESNAMQ